MILMYFIIFVGILVVSYIIMTDLINLIANFLFKGRLVKNHSYRTKSFKGTFHDDAYFSDLPRTFFTPQESSEFKSKQLLEQLPIEDNYPS